MSTKLKQHQINPEFADLFSFDSEKEEREHNAQMISFRILSEVEKVCEEMEMNKKQLAAKVKTSASYITQLFRGDKHINMDMMARFEEAFNSCFEVRMRFNTQTHAEFVYEQLCELNPRQINHKKKVWNRMDIISLKDAECDDNCKAILASMRQEQSNEPQKMKEIA